MKKEEKIAKWLVEQGYPSDKTVIVTKTGVNLGVTGLKDPLSLAYKLVGLLGVLKVDGEQSKFIKIPDFRDDQPTEKAKMPPRDVMLEQLKDFNSDKKDTIFTDEKQRNLVKLMASLICLNFKENGLIEVMNDIIAIGSEEEVKSMTKLMVDLTVETNGEPVLFSKGIFEKKEAKEALDGLLDINKLLKGNLFGPIIQ